MVRSILATAAAVTCAGLISSSAHAQNWIQSGGTHNWNDPANWEGGVVPNGVGAVANLTNSLTSEQVILISEAGYVLTLGTLNIGNPTFNETGPYNRYSTLGSNRPIRFDNGAEPARINARGNMVAGNINQHDFLSTGFGIFLDSDLIIDATHPQGFGTNMLFIRADIVDGNNGPKGITITGDSWVEFRHFGGTNRYGGLTKVESGRLRLAEGGLIPGDLEIVDGSVQHSAGGSSNNAIANDAIVRFTGSGFWNPGTSTDTIGGFESVGEAAHGAFVSGGVDAWVTFGANNQDLVYEGRFGQNVFEKIGTGVQTIGGTQHSWQSSSVDTNENLIPREFHVLRGRLDLAKTDGVAAIGHMHLNIGDGLQSGADRPEVRLLANEQIQTETDSGSMGDPSVTERTVVNFNAGVLNVNGFTETVGSVNFVGPDPATIDLGAGGHLSVRGNLTIDNFARAEVTSSAAGTVTVGGLVMPGPNRWLDLTRATLTVQNGNLNEITTLVQSGYNGGTWDGDGISSSAAAAEAGRALGIGQDGTDVIVKFTWAGDASLDGAVTIADLGILAANWQGTNRFWFHGDFNYDGNVTIADLGILAANWQKGVGAGAATMSFEEAMAMFDVFNGVVVPEPAGAGLLLGLGMIGLRRRRG